MNAYSYAHNSPLTKSDPDGLYPMGPTDHGRNGDAAWGADRGMYAGYHNRNGKWVWKQTPRKGKIFRQRYTAYRANPSHYLIDDSHARARAQQRAAARAQWQAQARARAAAEKRAQAERRKKDGIFGKITRGIASGINMSKGQSNLLGKAAVIAAEVGFEVGGYNNSTGMCASASGGIGVGGGSEFCVIAVRGKDGKRRYGWSRSLDWGSEGFKLGGSVNIGVLRSNADDISQFAGMGHDAGGSANVGPGLYGNHETAIGTKNSRGRQVSSIEYGTGWGIGLDLHNGFNRTWSGWY
ncbi:hypothetical protein [Streptomyces sp. NPDC087300]|uniref:hypothetical protein n=1 Tax=Streptomyces sp. NPDC087300 TaxID=3365780 RepID=UPI0037FD308A